MPGGSLVAQELSVNFGSLKALDRVSLEFRSGEVHAVVGENGAGKSTLMNVLAGFLNPSSGQILLDGSTITGGAPAHRARGIEMVHQHFRLVPAFTVEENLRLGLMRSQASVASALDLATKLDWNISPGTQCSELGVGERQRIEILKALASSPQIVIFDEATAVLSESEAEGLLDSLKGLAARGLTVILIAHKLAEVFAVADRISVLKGGVLQGTFEAVKTSPDEVAHLMIGSSLKLAAASEVETSKTFECRNLHVAGGCPIQDVSFEVGFGEVLGVGGVDGNGQVELAEALAGVRPSEGSLTPVGSIGYVPQDRHVDGLALSMSIQENLDIADCEVVADGAILEFEIKAQSGRVKTGTLSGGNQQKVVLARELGRKPELLVVVNPTRGLDVRAAAFVLDKIRIAAKDGAAVILISTDREELEAIANRTLFLAAGRLVDSATEALSA
jgi:simple sugar transport system ATP-binding protein